MSKVRERKTNLPAEVSTLGPFYVSTRIKDKFREACDKKGVHMETEIKGKLMETIKKEFPGWVDA